MINLVTSSGQSVGLIFLVHSIYFQTLFSKKLEQIGVEVANVIHDLYYVILLQMWFILCYFAANVIYK